MVVVFPQLAKLRGATLDLIFPQICVGCGKAGAFICDVCLESLPRIEPPWCPLCGIPQTESGLCHNCQDWNAEIDGIRAPFRFQGTVREVVHHLKYNNLRAVAGTVAKLLDDYLEENPVKGDLLIPVPLHRQRIRQRGYNQSALIARELGKITGLPVDETGLCRERYSLPQANTGSVEERRQNVAGVFRASGKSLKDKHIILVDDVATSGATMNACAHALKAAGAVSVLGLAFAREI